MSLASCHNKSHREKSLTSKLSELAYLGCERHTKFQSVRCNVLNKTNYNFPGVF